jgi:hypothetical protein
MSIDIVKFTGNVIAQGDVLIKKVEEIPSEFEKAEVKGNKYVVAHSETGHHHTVSTETVDAYESKENEFLLYLVVKEETQLLHERSFHTHKTISLSPGKYRISRQREYISEGFRRAQD